MSYEEDDIAETGDKHEIDGREYSVVGNTVYVKNFWGNWKLVEEEDEEAEAGDHKEINGQTYSVVGDTVYRKNWLGGWAEVEDENERAEAGEIEEVDGATFSRLGDNVYRKTFWGNWKLTDDDDEIAEAGDTREVNGIEYSVVGNTVYKKNWIGRWVEVEDENECGEAGDHYEVDNRDYSRTGDTIYKKNFWGEWEKISGPEEEEDTEERETSYRSSNNRYDYNDDDNSDYDTSDSTSYTSSSESGSGSPIIGLIVIIILVIAGYQIFKKKDNSPSVVFSNSTFQPATQPAVETPPSNPYGEGNGMVTFYHTCVYCQNIEVIFEGNVIVTVNNAPLQEVHCGGQGTFPVYVEAGTRVFVFRNENGETWEKTVEVKEGDCILVEAEKPDETEQPSETPTITTAPETANGNINIPSSISIISPKEREEFDYPRYTTVEWTEVEGAGYYEVEMQLADAPYDYSATSFSEMPYSNRGFYLTNSNRVTVQGMGKQVHRLRVKAIGHGKVILVSDWRYFNYIQ